MPDREDIGALARRLRRAHGLTQVELARLAEVGPRFVSEFERGKPTVRLDSVARVLAVFGLELATRPVPRPPVDDDFWDVSDMLPSGTAEAE